jgi:hypothetical protein
MAIETIGRVVNPEPLPKSTFLLFADKLGSTILSDVETDSSGLVIAAVF